MVAGEHSEAAMARRSSRASDARTGRARCRDTTSTISSSRPSVVNSPSDLRTPRSSDVSRNSVSKRAGRRRLNQVADGRQRVEQEVRVDLRPQRAQLRFCCQLADFLFANFAVVPFVGDADRVDPTCDEHGNGFQRRHVVGQQPAACTQLADRENKPRLICRRYGDAGRRWRGQADAAEAACEVGGLSAADDRYAERVAAPMLSTRATPQTRR